MLYDFLSAPTTLGYPCEKLKQKQNSGYPKRSITTINTTKNHAVDPQMQNRDGAFRISKSQFSKKTFFSSHFLKIEIFQKSWFERKKHLFWENIFSKLVGIALDSIPVSYTWRVRFLEMFINIFERFGCPVTCFLPSVPLGQPTLV